MQSSFSRRGPFTAFAMLVLFTERKLTLTEEQFDGYFDQVLAALEAANNEKFRLQDRTTEMP